ncbi:beta-arabinofuranosyltransferase RAY1 [Rhododendron vialii]|uniref:beta-arabinofuranosyltransferase RAY1 n=1 Tax=Rhododendron vialii TaxID=182163 RepID=UPI00265FB40C|nr:beta-arabinofuranosyltransferase RAY1 [Rhododendron vialii]
MKPSSPLSHFPSHKKAFQMGLWSIWLSGILLIALSFYATQKLPSSIKDQIKNTQMIFPRGRSNSGTPTITIFTAPSPPLSGSVGARQVQAIRSWIGLSPNITVVLFTQDPSVISFAGQFGSRVSAEPDIDFTFLGTPYFHSMVARSLASLSDVSVIIDPETILLPDFISALNYAHKLDHDWLLVSSSRHVSYFPFHLDKDGKHWLGEDGKQIKTRKLQGFLDKAWKWKHCEERMLLAWNNGDLPLHSGVLPPFLFGKGLHNSWVINEALSSKYRFVFDASLAISNFYLNPLDQGSYQSFGVSNVTNSGNRSWESVGNLQLGSLYGALYFHEANYSNMVKFCMNNGQYVFVNSAEATAYPFGNQRSLTLMKEKILGSRKGKKVADCVNGFKSLHGTRDCYVKDQLKPSNSLSLPYSLEMLLSGLSDKNRTVVLAIAGYNYKDMLMSWVCRLKSLLISNFLVCALDPEIYEFAILQGLPVFKDSLAPTNISFNDCHFGTQCFQRVTKVKSRLVLQILKLGYNVLLSDVDVYWFKNPLPFLYSFGPSVLVAQSDEYNQTGPINVPRRLNSGFYFARNDGSTVAALEKVVKHAATSNLSEQPSFYDTLCGEGGSNRVGDDRCFEPETNLTVHFLDRDLFPNGAYQGLWEGTNPKAICKKKGCFILHNNWISGRRKKLERQVLSGLWEYDVNSRMCVQSWQKAKVTSYF